MANQLLYPNTGGLAVATLVQLGLADSILSLFKEDISVTKLTTKEQLEAAEADYDGYLPETVADWLAPYLDPEGGASTDSGEIVFYWDHDTDDVGNAIYGFWLENAAGTVMVIGKFVDDQGQPLPVGMNGPGDAVPLTVRLVFGRSAA